MKFPVIILLVQIYVTASYIMVFSGPALQAAIDRGEDSVALASSIELNSTISISKTNVRIDGRGFSIDGQGRVGCLNV